MQQQIVTNPEPGIRQRGELSLGTILLVEDEDFVRNVTCKILRVAGYEVFATRTVEEAAKVFIEQSSSIALLLADIVLPKRSGSDLARELRALRPDLKVMLISGYPRAQVGALLPPDSDFSYLEKPFSAETLVKEISRVLRGAPQPLRSLLRADLRRAF